VAGVGSWLTRPEGVERAIESGLDPDALAARLADAAAKGRRTARNDGSPYVVRLGGAVGGRAVELEARLLRADGSAGRPKGPLLVTGRIDERPGGGSTLRVRIAPDDRPTLAWVIAIPALAAVLMAAAGLAPLAIVAVAGLAVPNVLGAVRAGQRFPLRSLSLVEALLEEIAGGG
jgi:hypothetical protein